MIKYTMEYTDKDGNPKNLSFDCPFVPWPYCDTTDCYCWIIHQNWRGKWYVEGHRVTGIMYKSEWGIIVDGISWWSHDFIGTDVFRYEDLDKAIDRCVKLNQVEKIEVKRNGL